MGSPLMGSQVSYVLANLCHLTLNLHILSSFECRSILSITDSTSAGAFYPTAGTFFLRGQFSPFAHAYYEGHIGYRPHSERSLDNWGHTMLLVMRSRKLLTHKHESPDSIFFFKGKNLLSNPSLCFVCAVAISFLASCIVCKGDYCYFWRYCVALMACWSCAVGLFTSGWGWLDDVRANGAHPVAR